MKYYKLKKDLPTFKAGDLFVLKDDGNLWHSTGGRYVDVMAYAKKTLELFPNILKDWFESASEPERDKMTKWKFFEYLQFHKDERFFQAVRNFANNYLRYEGELNCIAFIKAEDYSEQNPPVDTFYWECDEMLKEEE